MLRAQAQQMVMDTVGLMACVALMSAVRTRPQAQRLLPLAMLPPLAAGDLWCIWHELKAIHLRSLNRERAEMTAEAWLRDGEVPSARQVRCSCFYFQLPLGCCVRGSLDLWLVWHERESSCAASTTNQLTLRPARSQCLLPAMALQLLHQS